MNPNFEDFVQAIGAMAESLTLFRNQLVENGFSKEEALALSQTYLQTILGGKNGRDHQ